MVKSEDGRGDSDVLKRFDLGYIGRKYHMIFLYFLRLNQHIHALHARDVCLKTDVVRQVLQDFKNLNEFTLSFYQKPDKRKEASSLVQSILQNWHKLEYFQLENFQFNLSTFSDSNLFSKINQSSLKHISLSNLYLYNTKVYTIFIKRDCK